MVDEAMDNAERSEIGGVEEENMENPAATITKNVDGVATGTTNDISYMERKTLGDRLSKLPDPILYNILSFLDMKYVISTSVLAQRWRHLWTSVPVLSLDPLKDHKDFPDFVYRVLFYRQKSAIFSFRLFCGTLDCSKLYFIKRTHVNTWVRIAVWFNVEELFLQFHPRTPFLELPACLFTSNYLKILDLDFDGALSCSRNSPRVVIPTPDFIDLPLLRKLSLRSVALRTHFFDPFFLGSPVLEKLKLISCDLDESKSLAICGHQLKHLEIKDCEFNASNSYECKISVYAPNLISFTCMDYTSHDYSLDNLLSLELAKIYMVPAPNSEFDKAIFRNNDSKRMLKLLKGLRHVRSLKLYDMFLKVISKASGVLISSPTLFGNLRYLELGILVAEAYLQACVYLLRNSPNIENLVFSIDYGWRKAPEIGKDWGDNLSLQHLKCIEVKFVHGRDCELDLMKTFLKLAASLEKIIFSYASISDARQKVFVEELLACPQASSDLTILFPHKSSEWCLGEDIDENSSEDSNEDA